MPATPSRIRPVDENRRTAARRKLLFFRLLLVVLILCLAGSLFAVHAATRKAGRLSSELSAASTALQSLTEANTSHGAAVEKQQSDLLALTNKLASQEKAISSYEAQVRQQQEEIDALRAGQGLPASSTGGASTTAAKPKAGNVCYLTFDDGPSENTLKILKILQQYNVKATFFVVGTSKLSYVKNIHAAGHTVGLHSYTHEYSQIYTSQKAYFNDLDRISNAVQQYIGVAPKVIRFPGGSSNTVSKDYCAGIMTALSQEVRSRGYVYFDWNVDSLDATGNNVAVSKMLNNIEATGGKGGRDVVLMHDTDAKDTTVEALPQIIEYYKSAGYTFAPLTVNVEPITHGINN